MRILFYKWMMGALILLALVACSTRTKPTIALTSLSSITPTEGQAVTFQVSASDNRGVAHIELLEDGDVVADMTATPPQNMLMAPLQWRAVRGQHSFHLRAINADNVPSDAILVVVNVTEALATVPAPSPLPVPTAGLNPTNVPAPATPPPAPPSTAMPPVSCANNAQFVADVTVPDGTPWMPNQSFNKIWRLRNTGTCVWSNAYQLTFTGGEAMTGARAVGLNKLVQPNDTVDILITMTTPASAGAHSGQWQMADDQGILFGAWVRASIVTILPQPTGCMPTIQYWMADPITISRGGTATLAWGLVSNATRVEIDQGIGGVGTPGFRVVSPQQTTTYTLTAWCGNTVKQTMVTVYVNQPAPTPIPPTATRVPVAPTLMPPTPIPPTPIPPTAGPIVLPTPVPPTPEPPSSLPQVPATPTATAVLLVPMPPTPVPPTVAK